MKIPNFILSDTVESSLLGPHEVADAEIAGVAVLRQVHADQVLVVGVELAEMAGGNEHRRLQRLRLKIAERLGALGRAERQGVRLRQAGPQRLLEIGRSRQ